MSVKGHERKSGQVLRPSDIHSQPGGKHPPLASLQPAGQFQRWTRKRRPKKAKVSLTTVSRFATPI